MNAHIGADMAEVTGAHALLHGEESLALGDAGYRGVDKRPQNQGRAVQWEVALRPRQRRTLPKTAWARMIEAIEQMKAWVRAKVEQPFQFALADLMIAKRWLLVP